MSTNKHDSGTIVLRRPVHSDFIIHWTGKDIAKQYGIRANQREYEKAVVSAFLERLKSILEFGLWMKKRNGSDCLRLEGRSIRKPNVARVCFTELRLSDSTLHAQEYGPLGIGFKRYFLFNRLGAPMHYVHDTPNLFLPPLSNMLIDNSDNHEMLSFFKNMSSRRDADTYIEYNLYEESEWRIIYSNAIRKKIDARIGKYFIDPTESSKNRHHAYYSSLPEDNRPEYFLPLDGWLSMIIYPNIQVKNEAYKDDNIRQLLCNIKSNGNPFSDRCPPNERINQVMEIAIGSIKNF